MPSRTNYWSILLGSTDGPNQDKQRIRGEISLADLLIATKDLPWKNKQQLRQIAQSLGFTLKKDALGSGKTGPEQTKGVYDHNYYDRKPRPKQKEKAANLPFTAPPPPELPVELSSNAQVLPSELIPRDNHEPIEIPPDWLADESQFPPLLSAEKPAAAALPRENLFPDNSSRGIITATLATQRVGCEPDIPQIITRIVRGDILHKIPYEKSTTLDQGCQLLLDYNETMVPYWEDLNSLGTQLEDVIGSDRVERYEFKNHPLDAKQWISRKKHKGWKPKIAKPVLVASNLGQTGHGSDDTDINLSTINHDWQPFIARCQQHHVPLLILTPWQRAAWPVGLGDYPILIHWNPKTSASMVRQLIGNGLEVAT